jgi:hypothetical protein
MMLLKGIFLSLPRVTTKQYIIKWRVVCIAWLDKFPCQGETWSLRAMFLKCMISPQPMCFFNCKSWLWIYFWFCLVCLEGGHWSQ